MSNEGVEAGLSVPIPTRTPAASSSATGAMPRPSSAFERGQCATATSCSREQRDLLLVGHDAVGGEHVAAEQPGAGERANAGRAQRLDEHVGEGFPGAAARAQELVLVRALCEMGGDGQAELVAGAVELERAGVGSMRRDPEADAVRQRTGDPLAHRLEALGDGSAALAEHLEVDRAPEAEIGTGRRRGAAESCSRRRR